MMRQQCDRCWQCSRCALVAYAGLLRHSCVLVLQGNLAGRDLTQAKSRPIQLRLPDNSAVTNQLVYESHDYSFHW
jgi:hypothetical protein